MPMGKPPNANIQATFERGLALHREGNLAAAREQYKKVIARDPRHFDALHLLGTICAQSSQAELGASLLRRAVAVNPQVAAAHCALGSALSELGRPEEALASFARAIALQPRLVQAHYNLGLALGELGRRDEALRSYDMAIALKPDHVNAHLNRALLLKSLDRREEARSAFDRVIALAPDNAGAYVERAIVVDRPEEALRDCERAISLQPHVPEGHYSRGTLFHELNRHEEALESFDRALALRPDYKEARINRSFTLLVMGRFAEGWREYEWRKKNWAQAHANRAGRAWTGDEPLVGRKLFLFCEQGLGDTLQFWRYVKLLDPRGIAISASVQGPLRTLLEQNTPGVEVVGEDERRDEVDYHCSLLSLPLAFGTSLATIPGPASYLRADEALKECFAAGLAGSSKPRVGLAWSGSPTHVNDRNRSIAFETLLPLVSEDAQWIALQDVISPGDAEAFRAGGRVSFHGDQLRDFSHTAALVDLTDLVITVDTSIAHLAGALGKPVWILLPFNPDWRWLLDRTDSPWYPGARLFRQRRIGDWGSVIEEVRDELRNWTAMVGARATSGVVS